jgi:TPR repeat protein
LLHGVQVLPIEKNVSATERWSWILWYRDSPKCNDYSYEWFEECAKQGDAVCQELYATKIGNIPESKRIDHGDPPMDIMESIVYWNRASAEQGNGNAAIKMARAYLKLLPSSLSYNRTEAIRYYKLAMTSQHPDGYYGMATLYIDSLHQQPSITSTKRQETILSRVVHLLEEAAIRGHTYAMFNLGIVHCFGYGIPSIDTDLAALWFIQSGLPEGYYAAAYQAASMGNLIRQQQLDDMARKLGYYEPWRKIARERTGSGGASGIDLNMKWPVSADGRQPPQF